MFSWLLLRVEVLVVASSFVRLPSANCELRFRKIRRQTYLAEGQRASP